MGADRKEYQKQYYQGRKASLRENYNSQTQYVKWVDLKKTLNRLRKRIGNDSYNLILNEMEKLERERH